MSELYKLPKGWEWKQLGDISKLIGGGTPKRNMNEYWDNGNIVWLSPTDLGKIGDIIYISDSKDKITQLGLDKSSAKLLPVGTVLYSSRATIGKIAINTIEVSTNQGFTNFICNENLNNRYLAYILSRFTPEITSLSNSTTFKEVSKTSLKKFQIPLPPLQEQQRIVTKLDTLFEKIDKAIALHQKNMDEADVFMGSVLNEVFGELEEKKLIVAKQLDECFIVKDGTHDSPKYVDNGFPLFTSKNLKDYGLDTSNFKSITKEDYEKINQRSKVDKGDLLFAMIGTIGNPTIVNYEPNFAIKNVALFKPLDNKSLITYLKYYFMSEKITTKMKNEANGATQKFVGLTYLRKFPFPLVAVEVQQQIVSYLDSISQKTEKLKAIQKEKMQSLIALKASILDQAFRGEF